MKNAIEISKLSKSYGSFDMENISFTVPQGYISGLIGPNGAGKSTMIKMIMGMVHPDQGSIIVNGKRVNLDESGFKDDIGYVSDESIYFEYLSLEQMKRIIAPFYSQWNEDTYLKYMDLFQLPSKKKVKDCSKGMKMKYSIALALSHNPSLLIMDEPTAGLDPVFRRELLDILGEYILNEEKSILFSTHLTADLDRVADYITFLHGGRLVISDCKDDVLEKYIIVKGGADLLNTNVKKYFVGVRETSVGFEGLVANRDEATEIFGKNVIYQQPTLEEIMYFTAKGGVQHA